MTSDFQVIGDNTAAQFTLKLHRGDGMTLLGMNWKGGKPPQDFVGFAVEYREPKGDRFYPVKNRLRFKPIMDKGIRPARGKVDPKMYPTMVSPIQKFRWVHFPRNAELLGEFIYRVIPVFMNDKDELSYGDTQEAAIELRRETYPGLLNVTFTRGFVSSQAFVDRYSSAGSISNLLPAKAAHGLKFVPTHPQANEALKWMGFEAFNAILEVLDKAIADEKAKVRVVSYDLSEPEVVSRLEKLGDRLKIIIDDSEDHGDRGSGETQAAARLRDSAGIDNVKRQHMKGLQHNKTIVVDGPRNQMVVCGSTNFSWRGFFVQSNNALILQGASAVKPFLEGFEHYWSGADRFGDSASAEWSDLRLPGFEARVSFSPHGSSNALLEAIGEDIATNTTSSLFFSLAFLYQTKGAIRDAIKKVSQRDDIFVYGVSDKEVGGLDLQKPDGNVSPVFPAALTKNVPKPFSKEPTGGPGIRMHHKFVIIDFDKPTARVYLGSYNFSSAADTKNGDHLLLIRDRRIAISYVVEALRIFDHYHFRMLNTQKATKAGKEIFLAKPPRSKREDAWWLEDYTIARKIKDRELFA